MFLVILAVLALGSVGFAQAVNPFDNNVFAFFSDPVLFASTVAILSGWLVELVTDALKDRNVDLKGWHTQGIAAMSAALLAGAGGYFGLSYFTGLSGWEGAGTAASMALGAWLFADMKHRAGQLRKTGMRQQTRQDIKQVSEAASDTVLAGLIAAAKLIPPPMNVLFNEQVVRDLYYKHGAQFVQDLLDRQPKPDEVRQHQIERTEAAA